jgi:cell volume regulation protein A
MLISEIHATEIGLLVAGVLLLASVAASRVSRRLGIPVVLFFVGLGILAGSEGIGGIEFEDYALSYQFGTGALVLILLDGALHTPVSVVRRALIPSAVLATLGTAITSGIIGAAAHGLGFTWSEGLLVGAIVASTDAAAVFSVLQGTHLNERVGSVVELESGLNDPVTVLLTLTWVEALAHGSSFHLGTMLLDVLKELGIGAALGAAIGLGARWVLARVGLQAGGLLPLLTSGVAFVAYGSASLLGGSGFLAVYGAGILIGSARLESRDTLLRAHEFLGWASQIGMFILLGLLVFPSRLWAVTPTAVALALALALVARPLAVTLCLAPLRFSGREIAMVGWAGLGGAVPIILATIPVLAHVGNSERIFDIVFFVVLVSTALQGGTIRWLAHRLALVEQP